MSILSPLAVEAFFHQICTAASADKYLSAIFGNAATATINFLKKYPDITAAGATLEADFPHLQLAIQKEVASSLFAGTLIAPADFGVSSSSHSNIEHAGRSAIPLDVAVGTIPASTPRSLDVVDGHGHTLGRILFQQEEILANEYGLLYIARNIRHLLDLKSLLSLPFGGKVEFGSLLAIPAAIAVCETKHKEKMLLAATDWGFVATCERAPIFKLQSHSQPIGPQLLNREVSTPRRRLLSRAINTHDIFDRFIRLYNVLEHAFLESFVDDLKTSLVANQPARVRALLSEKQSERVLLARVFKDLVFAKGVISGPTSQPYPGKGHVLYSSLGYKPEFFISGANFQQEFPGLVYLVRCAIVHTKADQCQIDTEDAQVADVFKHCLLPDMMKVARGLVENW